MSSSVMNLCRLVVLVVLMTVSLASVARADRINLLADFEYLISDNKVTDKESGEVTKTKTDRFSQLYSLDMDKSLAPYLTFNAGGVFESNETERKINEEDTPGWERRTNRQKRIRPYLGLELKNPFYTGGVSYRESERKNSGNTTPTTRDFSEEYSANFSWRPSDLPTVNMDYSKLYSWDEPKTRDSVFDAFNFSSRYDYKEYTFSLTHSRNDTRNKLDDFESKTRNYSGGVIYSDTFMDDRLGVNAALKLDRSTSEFSSDPLVQTIPRGNGFYLLDDPFPETNLPGEFTDVGAGTPFTSVNLGTRGGTNQRSVGLFFSSEVRVDVIWVPLLREDAENLTDEAANKLIWTLYVSDDQLDWEPVAISSVQYVKNTDNILQGFGFKFRPGRAITEEYFKLVTTPLEATDPINPQDVRVLDVQAWTIPSSNKITSTGQYYSFGLDYKLSEKTSVGYDMYYQTQESDPGSERSRLSNGINLRHRFNPVFLSTSSLLRTDSWENNRKDTTTHLFTSSMNAYYMRTFNQTLTYSMTHTDERAGTSLNNSVVLRSNLDVYKGVSVSLDQGYSWQKPYDSGDVESFFLRGRTHIIPHRRVDLNLDYSVTWTSEEGEENSRTETGRFSGFWLVLDTLSLSTDINVRRTDTGGELETRVVRNYTATWSPLLHGDIQFSTSYNQTGSTDGDDSWALTETLLWRMTSYSLLTLTHSQSVTEDNSQKSENESIFMNVRIYY